MTPFTNRTFDEVVTVGFLTFRAYTRSLPAYITALAALAIYTLAASGATACAGGTRYDAETFTRIFTTVSTGALTRIFITDPTANAVIMKITYTALRTNVANGKIGTCANAAIMHLTHAAFITDVASGKIRTYGNCRAADTKKCVRISISSGRDLPNVIEIPADIYTVGNKCVGRGHLCSSPSLRPGAALRCITGLVCNRGSVICPVRIKVVCSSKLAGGTSVADKPASARS